MLCFLFRLFVNMQDRWGKFILFLALAKRGKGNALFVFFVGKALDKKQNVLFPLWWTFSFIFWSHRKNGSFRRKNVVYKRKNISYRRSNINYKHENIICKDKNITFRRANIFYKRENIKKS